MVYRRSDVAVGGAITVPAHAKLLPGADVRKSRAIIEFLDPGVHAYVFTFG